MNGDDNLPDADYWESLVRSGKSKGQATALVEQRRRTQPFAGPARGTSRSFGDAPVPKLEGMARAANQGLSFGLSDEISAGLGAGMDKVRGQPFGASYSRRVGEERRMDRQFKDEHPVLGYGAEIAGGIATGSAIPKLAKMGAVKGGAVAGAAYGAGASEGGLQNRAIGAGVGASVGALGGGVVEGTARIASPMMRAVAARLGPGSKVGQLLSARGMDVGPQQIAASDAEQDILRQFTRGGMTLDAAETATRSAHPDAMLMDVGGDSMLRRARGVHAIPSKGSADIHSALTARVQGQPGRVQDRVSGALTGKPRESATETARKLIAQRRDAAKPIYDEAFGYGVIQNPETIRHVEELRKFPAFEDAWRRGLMNDALEAGDPSVPAWAREEVPDFKAPAKGKPSGTARLESGGLRSPKQMADDELLGEIERLIAGRDMDQAAVDAIPGDVLDESRGLRSLGMKEDADGLVRGDDRASAAMSRNRANQRQKSLDKLYAEAEKRGLFKGNADEWADDADAESFLPTDAPKGITVRQLDAWKKGLDATIESGRGSINALSRNEARLYRQRLDAVLKMVDDEVPAYGEARKQFAGDSRLIDAYKTGREFPEMDRDELADVLGAMSDGEKELVRRGVLSTLSTDLAKVTDGRDVTRMFQNPLMREKLTMLLPDQNAADQFMADLAEETRLHKNAGQVLSGSPTSRIDAEKADDMGSGIAQQVIDVASGNPSGAMRVALRRLLGPSEQRGLTEAKADALAPLLTAKGDRMREIVEQMRQRQAKNQGATTRRAGFSTALVRPMATGSGREQ